MMLLHRPKNTFFPLVPQYRREAYLVFDDDDDDGGAPPSSLRAFAPYVSEELLLHMEE